MRVRAHAVSRVAVATFLFSLVLHFYLLALSLHGPLQGVVYQSTNRVAADIDVMLEAEQDDVLRSIGTPLSTVTMTLRPTTNAIADADDGDAVTASRSSDHENVFEVVLSGEQLARASCDDRGFLHTGDHVAKRPSGALVLRGRKDNQIKRSGRRVNLEEIDAAVVRGCGGLVTGALAFCRIADTHSVVESAVVMPTMLIQGKLNTFLSSSSHAEVCC